MTESQRLPDGQYAACPNGHRIHYIDQGEGPAVVFLHGSGPGASGHSNFKGNYPALANKHGATLVPFFLQPLMDRPDLVQYDKIHPTKAGIEALVAATVDDIAGAVSTD